MAHNTFIYLLFYTRLTCSFAGFTVVVHRVVRAFLSDYVKNFDAWPFISMFIYGGFQVLSHRVDDRNVMIPQICSVFGGHPLW